MLTADTAAILGTVAGIAFSLISGAITYGVMQTRIDTMRIELDRLKEEHDGFPDAYVTRREFDASVQVVKELLEDFKEQMRRGFDDVRSDMRHYLTSESKPHSKRPV